MVFVGGIVGLVIGFLLAVPIVTGIGVALGIALLAPPLVGLVIPPIALGFVPAIIVYFVVVLIAYTVAHASTAFPAGGGLATSTPLEPFARGVMLGINAMMNFVALSMLPLVGILALPVAVINVLAFFPAVSNNAVYQAFLGWFGWAMPMAWPVQALGIVVLAINAGAGLFGVPFSLRWEWWMGTLVTHGGIVYAPWSPNAAWNLANFVHIPGHIAVASPWIDASGFPRFGTVIGITLHELGHTLSVAAFGFYYHIINAIHQNVPLPVINTPPAGGTAYAEMVAEGPRRSGGGGAWLPVWTPSLTPAAPGNIAPSIGPGATIPPVVARGSPVLLNAFPGGAGASTDPDAYIHPLGAFWSLSSSPDGSTAAITSAIAPVATLTPDVGGRFEVVLFLTDGDLGGAAPLLTIDAVGANAGGPYASTVGAPVPLDGTASDAGALGIAFAWSLQAGPAGATASFSDAASATPDFVADTPGQYIVVLTVTAGGVSDAAAADVTVTSA